MRSRLPGSLDRAQWGLLLAVAGLVVLTAGYFTLPLDVFGPHHPIVSWISLLCALALIAALLLRQIQRVRDQQDDRGRPALAIALLSYLSLLVFATTYLALSGQGGEFAGLNTRVDALYFTVVTMATIGYGDITPTGQEARSVVLGQIVYTFLFLAAGASAFGQQLRSRRDSRARRGRE